VTHFLTAGPLSEPTLPFVGRSGMAYIYRVQDAARLRFVRTGLNVATDVEAMRRLVDPNFDPNREVLLHEAPPTRGSAFIRSNGRSTSGPPKIVSEDAGAIEVEVDAPSDGFLLLADTYYPGWIATVDGAETPIFRANLSVSAISITEGRHDVRFVYKSWAFKQGFRISIEAVVILFLILGVTAAYDRAGR
jgi:hypothetical protein